MTPKTDADIAGMTDDELDAEIRAGEAAIADGLDRVQKGTGDGTTLNEVREANRLRKERRRRMASSGRTA